MGFSYFNPNPEGKQVGDCTVRAIAKATGKSWDETYVGLCLHGLKMGGHAVGKQCLGRVPPAAWIYPERCAEYMPGLLYGRGIRKRPSARCVCTSSIKPRRVRRGRKVFR